MKEKLIIAASSITILLLATQDYLVKKTGISFIANLDEIMIIILFLFSLIRAGKNKIPIFSLKIVGLLLLFIFIGISSCYINSVFDFKSVMISCFLSIKFWILLLSISIFKTNRKYIDSFYKGLFFVEKIVIVFAIFNILLPNYYKMVFPMSFFTYRFNLIAVCSIFIHPGKYGYFMLFCALAHLSKYHKTKEKREIINTIIATAACLISLRTKVILSVAVCGAGYLIYIKRNSIKKQAKKFAILGAIMLCTLVPFKSFISKTYILYFTDAEGYSVRQALLDNSIKIMSDYFPMGVGFGKYGTWYASVNYSEYYSKYGMSNMYGITSSNTSYSTDTYWPAIFGETGAIGSIAYTIMLILLMRQLIKNSQNSDETYCDIALLAPMALTQTIVESFGSSSFSAPPQYFFTAFTIGLALSRKQEWRIKNGIDKKS